MDISSRRKKSKVILSLHTVVSPVRGGRRDGFFSQQKESVQVVRDCTGAAKRPKLYSLSAWDPSTTVGMTTMKKRTPYRSAFIILFRACKAALNTVPTI